MLATPAALDRRRLVTLLVAIAARVASFWIAAWSASSSTLYSSGSVLDEECDLDPIINLQLGK
jgi:type 1 fimbria pilin